MLKSVMDESKVEHGETEPGRNISIIKWRPATPPITTETLCGEQSAVKLAGAVGTQELEPEGPGTQSITVKSLNTPISWLLIWAHEQATCQFISQAKIGLASAQSSIDCVVTKENVWQTTWENMCLNLR